MAKSAFTQMKTTSLLSDLLAVLICFPNPPVQVGTAAALSFGEAVSEPPASCQQPQLHASRLTPQVLKFTAASGFTPALHSTRVDSSVQTLWTQTSAAIQASVRSLLSFTLTEAQTEF